MQDGQKSKTYTVQSCFLKLWGGGILERRGKWGPEASFPPVQKLISGAIRHIVGIDPHISEAGRSADGLPRPVFKFEPIRESQSEPIAPVKGTNSEKNKTLGSSGSREMKGNPASFLSLLTSPPAWRRAFSRCCL